MAKDSKGGEGVLISGGIVDLKARSLFHALAEIQQFSVCERDGTSVPADAVTLPNIFSFAEVGLKSSFFSILISTLSAILMFSVFHKLIRIFGSSQPHITDSMFLLMSSIALPVGYAFIIHHIIAKAYRGETSSKLISYLLTSFIAGKVVMSVVIVALLHILYYKVLTPAGVYTFLNWIPFMEGTLLVNQLASYIFQFKEVLIPTAWFIFVVHIVSSAIIVVGDIRGKRRTRRIEEFRKEWE